MKWVALIMIAAGIVPLTWSLMQDKKNADLQGFTNVFN